MKEVLTDEIVREVGEAWYTLLVDGTKDDVGVENVSIVIRYYNEETHKVLQRLLVMTTSLAADAKTLTEVVCSKLEAAGLKTTKILSQVYDGASVMSGKHGGVQRLLQEKEKRNIPYIHCFNHQLHLVIIHCLSADEEILDFFDTCRSLYNFFKKPSVAVNYTGTTLKRLLEQRWSGHFAALSTILSSFDDISTVLQDISAARIRTNSDTRIKAAGLLKEASHYSFMFIARHVYKVSTSVAFLV